MLRSLLSGKCLQYHESMLHVFDVGLAAFLGAWPANIALKPHSLPMYVSQLTPTWTF